MIYNRFKIVIVLILIWTESYSQFVYYNSDRNERPTIWGGVYAITNSTASFQLRIIGTNGSKILQTGLVYTTSPANPVLGRNINSEITTTRITGDNGVGSATVSGGLNYRSRIYARTPTDTVYGDLITFTTPTNSPPTVTTNSISYTSCFYANGGGNVTSQGDASVTSRGLVWSKTISNPTTSSNDGYTTDGSGIGSFSSTLSGLSQFSFYYVRAYATNSYGTSYGDVVTFATLSDDVLLSSSSPYNKTQNSVTIDNTIGDAGCSYISSKGIVWNTSEYPTISSYQGITSDGAGSSNFTSNLTGLSSGITYYARAYATNSTGTWYGTQVIFSLGSCSLPYIISASCGNPSVTTMDVTATILSDGGCVVTSRGFQYSTDASFSTVLGSVTASGTGIGQYYATITGLTCNTQYYFRPWATNSAGTYYATSLVGSGCYTLNCSALAVTTTNVSNITGVSAMSGGNVISDGGSSVTARGVCWSLNQNPTISNSKTIDGSGTGNFTSSITGLSCGNTYYVRAYATNSAGTAYGNSVTFSTELCIYIPTVSLNTINKYGDTYATFSGSVTDDGNSAVTERGFVYSTTPNPTTSSNKIISGSGVGVFSANAYGLFSSTKYYVRAYAINNVGTAYSNELDFITFESSTNVSISTSVPVNITTNSATLGGNISSDGGNTVTERGVVYGLSINPTTSNTKIQSGDGIGIYSVNVTGLTQGTTYHVRAYAINSNGTFYGADESFITSIDGTTACNAGQTFPGGQSYPSTNTIVLGSGTGDVTLTFSAYDYPDFFLVEYNSTIYNSGWRGSSIYDYGGNSRSAFKSALWGKIDPTNPSFPTTFPNITLYPEDGYPRVNSTVATGSISFTKSTSNPTTATVKVYAPMSSTYWTYILSCPN